MKCPDHETVLACVAHACKNAPPVCHEHPFDPEKCAADKCPGIETPEVSAAP